MPIPLSQPWFDDDEQREVAAVLNSGWVMQGPKVAELEGAFRDYVGAPWAVAVSSCSTALHLAMRAAGIGPGDEVIVPSLTWIATAAAIEECGARPVFCDVRLTDFNIDASQIEALLSPRTRAIIVVNLFGLAADLPAIKAIADRAGVILIEDAACSLGATVNGKQSGTFGRMGCFSFHPRKSITTGEGGMIVGSDLADERLLRSLRSHGVVVDSHPGKKPPFDLGDFDNLGYNYRLTDIQAAVGVAQMRKLERILQRRREIAAYYDRELADLELISLPRADRGFVHSYQSYVLYINPVEQDCAGNTLGERCRNQIMLELESRGIATRPGTHAVHALAYYRTKYGLSNWSFPNSYRAMTQTIALPLYPKMSQSDCEFIVENVHQAHDRALQACDASRARTKTSQIPRLAATTE